MPGLMIVLALVLAPAVDSGLKDPWAAGRASPERRDQPREDSPPTGGRSDLRNPFESAPLPPRSGDLKNPFRGAAPRSPERSADLQNPFEDSSPQASGRRSDLRDPFDRPRGSSARPRSADLKDPFDDHDARKRVDPSGRTDSLELRNPFAPRPRRRAR